MQPGKNSAKVRLKLIRGAALLAWVVLLLAPSAAPAQQALAPKGILVLNWYNKDYSGNIAFDQGFQSVLKSEPAGSIEYYSEYLETNRFPGDDQAVALRDYLRRKYAHRSIDVIVATADPPLDFLLKYRAGLFPHAPIVFGAARSPSAKELAAGPGMTGLINHQSYRKNLDLALSLHPGTEHVFIVSGSLGHDKRHETVAREDLHGYESKVSITYLTDLTLDELVLRMKRLPERSIVLYVWQQAYDEKGKILETQDILPFITNSTTVPIYGQASWQVGKGVVGGYVRSSESNGKRLAEIALRIANGERAQDIPVEKNPIVPMFDWRELGRWGISEDHLPPGHIVLFRELSFWDLYKWRIIGVISLCVVEALLILALLAQRARRRRVEAALRDNEERLKLALSAANMGAWDWRLDANELMWSEETRSIFGLANGKSAITPKAFLNLIHPDDRPAVSQAIARAIEHGALYDVEFRAAHPDGSVRWVMGKGKALLDEAGQAARMLGVNMDITDRKLAEDALRRSEERLRLAQRAARVGTWDWNLVTGESNWSEGIYELLGLAQGDGRANVKDFAELIHPEDREPAMDKVESVIKYGEEYYDEFRVIRRDGSIAWLASKGRVIRGPSGSAERMIGVNIDITDRKRAEERLRSYFELPLIGMAITSPDRRFVEVNQKLCDILGYSKDQLTGMSWVDVTHPDDVAENIRLLDETLRGKTEGYVMDKRFMHRDGHIVYTSISTRCARRADRSVDYLALIVQDITQRKQAEDRLMESEAQLRLLTELIPQHVWTAFPGNPADFRNRRWLDYTGMTIEEVRHKGWMTAVHPDDHERVVDAIRESSSQKGIYEVEIRLKGVDGQYRWFLARAIPQVDGEGNIIKWYGTNTDIEDRKQAEEALRLSEDKFSKAFRSSPDAFAISRQADGMILEVNERWEEILGYARDEAVGRTAWDLQIYPNPGERKRLVSLVRERGYARDFEIDLRKKSGEIRNVSISAEPFVIRDEPCLILIVRDITERKRAGEALRESEERLRHALEAGRMGVWERDTRTNAVKWSKETYMIMGLSPFSIEPHYHTWADRVHPDDLPVANEKMRKAIEEKGDFRYEYRIIWPDGSVRWVEGHGKPVYDEDGQCLKVSGLIVDITERKRTYLRLNTQYAISHILSEAASVADAASRLLQVICESLGWEFGEIWLVDREADRLTFLESWSQPSKELAEFASASRQFTFPPGVGLPGRVWKSRQPAWILDVTNDSNFPRAPLAQRAGLHNGFGFPAVLGDEMLGVMVFFSREVREPDEDLLRMMASIGSQVGQFAERRQADEALRESEARFRNMADNAPVMVWMTEADGACSYQSQSWYEFTGQTPETGLGFGWVAALHPDDRELSEKIFLAANERREAFRLEYRLWRNDGEYRWAIDSARPRFGSQGEFLGYIGSVVDITETKQAELNIKFINQLDFELSQIADADEIIRLATSRLGEYLGVSSCYVIEVNPAAGLAFVRESWEGWRNAGPSIVGEYRISDFVTPECLDEFEAGRATVVKDVMNDPRIRDFASKYKSLGIGAFISIPALNERQWEANLTVDHTQARDWRPDETQLMRDITARLWPAFKRARAVEALRESEERYRSVVESQTELICRYLPDTTLTFVNDAYCRYFGKLQEELIGTKFLDFIPEPAREIARKHIESLVESPRVEIDEHEVLLPKGGIGWQQWVDHAILDANGKVVEFQAVGRDITERKLVEEERREGEERLRLALEAGRMGVWEWDTRTNVVKWSKEHYTVMGLMPFSVEPEYHTWADHVHPDDLPVATEAMSKAIEKKREYRCEYRIIWPDGSVRWVEGRGKPIYDEGGECLKVSGLIVDITERKEAEEALRESEEALRRSYARIEDLAGRLIASQEEERRHIARELHDDLNQQVAALAIGISRLKRQFPDAGAAVQEQIVKLQNKTDMLSERIRQVSHELHSSILQHVGLPAALNSYCAEFSDREGIAVALDIGDGIEGVPPEAALCLYRVAQESLRNVARHSGARRAVVTLARANGAIELRVADQGAGFDPGQAHECRGLGLVSMEERVKLLHGSFVLTTGPGAGTELRAQIPLRGDHEQTTGIVG